jgi:hypothetical protein
MQHHPSMKCPALALASPVVRQIDAAAAMMAYRKTL